MKVQSLRPNQEPDGVLAFNRLSETTANVHHFNNDDGHYLYSYKIEGTKEELDVIEEFSAKLTGYFGKKSPYISMDCKHQYQEVSAQKANQENNYSRRGKKSKVHPGLDDYKIFKCQICEEYQDDYFFKGYPVELFSSEFDNTKIKYHKVMVWVHPMPFKNVPKSVEDERTRHCYIDPSEEEKLVSLGFKKTGGYCGGGWSDPNKKMYFEYKYPNPLKK